MSHRYENALGEVNISNENYEKLTWNRQKLSEYHIFVGDKNYTFVYNDNIQSIIRHFLKHCN